MEPTDPRHGTNAGYFVHYRRGEPSCTPCRRAHSIYVKQRPHKKRSGGKESPESRRRGKWRKRGIDPNAAETALGNHDGACALCGATYPGKQGWIIDHDHALEPLAPVRGVLCTRCNVGLGMLRDDPALLAAGLAYLNGDPIIMREPTG